MLLHLKGLPVSRKFHAGFHEGVMRISTLSTEMHALGAIIA